MLIFVIGLFSEIENSHNIKRVINGMKIASKYLAKIKTEGGRKWLGETEVH